ncbi:putative aromatic acid decarboxylase [Desulfamplus magnetovallimortis]|uniref:Flavin prenyltransferase UbiX n=1 Tax=Desulfamplus magnetovallimortis TaxID=1246637 RepID=A0A1W1HFP2_9BACT|nr:UbiX family flavin prenyltransferase [Desulfamplus magnetovallimortis]SLM31331.1 putative aromatic acid decarboxylase [Desulfamplus magnetovallimortis]
MTSDKKFIVAITGASGTIYAIRLLKNLLEGPNHVILIISDGGIRVLEHETIFTCDSSMQDFLALEGTRFHSRSSLEIFSQHNFSAGPASGSFIHNGMVIAPCSMKTLSAVASGFADNLLTRSADVCLKEKRPLILLPRETPLNLIHLENMTKACRAGATIMPPCPSFYSFPQTVEALADSVVARILDHLGVQNNLVKRWSNL